jgi:hypothetical protein
MAATVLDASEARRLILGGQAPAYLTVNGDLDLSNETSLTWLPEGLEVGRLVLANCSALQTLPDHMKVFVLDMSNCVSLQHFPEDGPEQMARLNISGCTHISALPSWLKRVAQLDVSGCTNLQELPDGLHVVTWLDVAHTPLRKLPQSLEGIQLRWRGVMVDEHIAFHPETITARQVLEERNAERRRVMLEILGYESFVAEAQAQVLHQDRDAGGERLLLQAPLQDDEPLVCLQVQCPSTGRRYLIRVPPTMRQCHQAAAWIAGFDDPDQYRPLMET